MTEDTYLDELFTGLIGDMVNAPQLAIDIADLLVRHKYPEWAETCHPWTANDAGDVWILLSASVKLPEFDGKESRQKVIVRKADGAVLVFLRPVTWKVPDDIVALFPGPSRFKPFGD